MITNGNKKANSQVKIEEHYKLDKLLGFGSYSKVRLAKEVSTGREFAIKIIDSIYHNSKGKNKFLRRELDALEKIYHNNVIQLYCNATYLLENDLGCLEVHDCIVLEYAKNGSLLDYIFHEKKGFNERIARTLFLQLVNAVESCHDVGIANGDVKTENILFQSDWTIKICDFGNSYTLGSKNVDVKEGTTKHYCAPEIWGGDKSEILGAKADIFSLGIILFILVTGSFPFTENTHSDFFYRKVKTKKMSGMWEQYKERISVLECLNLSNELKELFIMLVQFDQKDRPSVEEIKKSKWLQMEFASTKEVAIELEKRKKNISKM